MKKFLTILCIICIIFTFCACGYETIVQPSMPVVSNDPTPSVSIEPTNETPTPEVPVVIEPTSEPPIVEEEPINGITPFLGTWYAQGVNILWEVTIYEDGTFFNHYPNYSIGDMSYTWKLNDNEDTIILFEDNYSFDEYGNLVDKEWNAQGRNYAQRILSRIPNIMGEWKSEDGEFSFYLYEHDYGKTFSFDSTGIITFFDTEDSNVYQYNPDTDLIYVYQENNIQSVLYRWYDDTLR